MLTKAVIFSCIFIFFAYFATFFIDENKDVESKVESIYNAWAEKITKPEKNFERLHVGINCNVDLIVPSLKLLKALQLQPGNRLNKDELKSLDDLQSTFAYFFHKGSAAERAFLDKEIFNYIVKTADKIEDKNYFIGGNAALMANKIIKNFPDIQLKLVGPIGPKLQSLLPTEITIADGGRIATDEVHLIMEYSVGDQWGGSVTPVATRFITSYDESNSRATMIETFFSSLNIKETDLVLFSGLHMLESQSEDFFSKRLEVIREGFKSIPESLPVHLELASMVNPVLVRQILQKVVPMVHSLGLNEQELTFASMVANGPHKDEFRALAGHPEIHKMSDIVYWLLKTFGRSSTNTESRLTRVHFHTLTFHIIGTVKDHWGNTNHSVAAGAKAAGIQACDMDQFSASHFDLRIPEKFPRFSGDEEFEFDPDNPIVSWEKNNLIFVLSPVLVCKNPLKTVGLGDAISGTGLMFSEFVFV